MKHIRKFNENNQDKLINFYEEYKKLCKEEDLGNHELWVEIGQLTLKYDLSKDDVLYILNNFNCKFDVFGFLKQTLEDWDSHEEDKIWDELLNKLSGYSFSKDYEKVLNILKSKYSISRK
jgi:hypothetical protein